MIQFLELEFGMETESATAIVEKLTELMYRRLLQDGKVLLPNIGVISAKKQEAHTRKGFGKSFEVPEKLKLKITTSKNFEAGWEDNPVDDDSGISIDLLNKLKEDNE